MSNSLIEAAGKFDFELKIGCPEKYAPGKKLLVGQKKIKLNYLLVKNRRMPRKTQIV